MKWGFQVFGVQITVIDTDGAADLTLMDESGGLYEWGVELLRQQDEEGADHRAAVVEIRGRLREIREQLAERGYYPVKKFDFQTGDVYVDYVQVDDLSDEEYDELFGGEEEREEAGPGRDVVIGGDDKD